MKLQEKEVKIMPGNVAKESKITQLRNRWLCNMLTCANTYCFVPPDNGPHLDLSMKHFDVWLPLSCVTHHFFHLGALCAFEQLKGPEAATIDKPPNHHYFNAISAHNLTGNTLLQQRRASITAKDAPASPVFNLHLPENLLAPLNPNCPVPAAAPNLAPPFAITNSKMLLVPAMEVGLKLTVLQFCLEYRLSASIQTKLTENGYVSVHTFKYIEVDELKDMGFLRGEIAELKIAVDSWAIHR
jgi:hypothetical protein